MLNSNKNNITQRLGFNSYQMVKFNGKIIAIWCLENFIKQLAFDLKLFTDVLWERFEVLWIALNSDFRNHNNRFYYTYDVNL